MALGRRVLLKAGMSPALVERCFRGFFTYSVGVYDELFGLVRHVSRRRELLSQVWKGYLLNVERCERALHEWGLACVRSENARREEMRRMEHTARVDMLRGVTTRLQTKVTGMQQQSGSMGAVATAEQESMRSLGRELRDMQHQYELGVETKAHMHTEVAEHTIKSVTHTILIMQQHGFL